ncbi:MAG: hypothetical protein GY731_07045 [Gammaproteobacteria bacterium]|nr:hypothetical protein [Gammaproteobacteria bacterium]
MGWAVITHPFHPLHGQRFEVLKTRKVSGTETLVLRHSGSGSHAVAREWTDWAIPSACNLLNLPQSKLEVDALLDLAELLSHLNEPAPKEG